MKANNLAIEELTREVKRCNEQLEYCIEYIEVKEKKMN
jgi:hypothetical protein